MTQPATVQDLLELYVIAGAARGNSTRTCLWYREQVERFLTWLRANDLHRGDWLQSAVIERYLADSRKEVDLPDGKKRKGNAPATVAGHYRALRGFFEWLVDREYIAVSPMADMKPPKVPRKEPRRALVDDFIGLYDSIPADDWVCLRDRLVVSTLFLCGIRLGECAGMKIDAFNTAQHTVAVDGKTGPRLVPTVPTVERAFVAYLYARPASASPFLLLASNGGKLPLDGPPQPNGLRQMVVRRSRQAGVTYHPPHSFRHGLAMMLLNDRGADMSLVQKVLGHSQISTTAEYYAEWLTEGMVREFLTKMDGVNLGR
jgi:site-specific recombinase XerD